MKVESEYEDLARELHATRAEPRPEYARQLDARAAEWLRERPRRRLPSLRVAVPAIATATAAVVVALVVAGGEGGDGGGDGGGGPERLVVAVVSAEAPPAAGGAGEALQAPLERESKTPATDDARALTPDVLALENFRAPADGHFVVSYQVAKRTRATVELAGATAKITLDPERGSIEVGVEGLPPGAHRLEISMRGVKVLSERVAIDG